VTVTSVIYSGNVGSCKWHFSFQLSVSREI